MSSSQRTEVSFARVYSGKSGSQQGYWIVRDGSTVMEPTTPEEVYAEGWIGD